MSKPTYTNEIEREKSHVLHHSWGVDNYRVYPPTRCNQWLSSVVNINHDNPQVVTNRRRHHNQQNKLLALLT
jgi:hypothetical protein